MRVLLISHDPAIARRDGVSCARMKAYAQACDRLYVIGMGNADHEETFTEGNLTIRTLKGGRVARLVRAVRELSRVTRMETWDVISAQEPFESGAMALWAARRIGARCEIQLHGDFYSNDVWKKSAWINALRHVIGWAMLKRADAVRAVSPRIERSIVARGIPAERVRVVPVFTPHTASNSDRVAAIQRVIPSAPRVVCVARLTKEKGVLTLAQAIPYIVGTWPSASIVIVGDGPQREEIAATAKSLGTAEHLFMVGEVDNPADYFAAADVVVIPSRTEGWSRVAVEAALAGKPIVMTDVGLAGDVLTHRREALIIPIDNPGRLANAVIHILAHPQEAHDMACAARQAAEQLPSREECIARVVQGWERLTKQPARA